ncbi:restriction endonuclease subunit S [Paucibacter sp. B2R-40]|uniref:restriction endonuclease subunit S n=1 Tax=Paucibacter sp. B2R-40 TaxID=2893554 RepID=UPI0021E49315|nr:restriction endonuclease subunit S [Paucibacter sp. B2R-40]MCV2354568.1 restriction endonuclease subunit S [Paucibacter sp. B2R-40]
MKVGWQTKALGELCEFQRGLTYGKADEVDFSENIVLRANNVDLTTHRLDLSDLRYISDTVRVPPAKKLLKGSLLICTASGSKSHLGKIAYVDEDYGFAFGGFMGQITPTLEIDNRYLFHALTSPAYKEFIEALSDGLNINNLKFDDLKQFVVAFPPLQEQRRIVAILDEALEAIATAKANAEKNLLNARELFNSQLRYVFATAGETCEAVRIEDVCESIMDCVNKTAPKVDGPTPFKMIRTTNVRHGRVSLDSVNYVSEETYLIWTRRQTPQRGDVILTREAPMGEVGMLLSDEKVFLGQRVVSYRANAEKLDNRFLLYALQSQPLQDQIRARASGSTVQHMRVPDSKNLQLPLPSLNEQKSIVEILDALREGSHQLEAIYRSKLAALAELKKSLLQQAFSGKLTASKHARVTQPAALQTTSPEFTANVIAIAYARHARQMREKSFGRVKEQKTLHLVEAIAKIDLGRQPMRDAAGPNDFQQMLKAEAWAKAVGFFEMVSHDGRYEFKKLSAFEERLATANWALAPYLPQLDSVIDLLVPMDKTEAEVFATVLAAWNNLLIEGSAVTDDAIVSAAREGWHADKLEIPGHRFRSAIELIRQKGLIPDGTAKYVGGQQSLL